MFNTYSDLWHFVLDNFDQADQLVIEYFITYYMNEYKGLGEKNSPLTFHQCKRYDATGKLHHFALMGFEFEKKIYHEQQKEKENNKMSSLYNNGL